MALAEDLEAWGVVALVEAPEAAGLVEAAALAAVAPRTRGEVMT